MAPFPSVIPRPALRAEESAHEGGHGTGRGSRETVSQQMFTCARLPRGPQRVDSLRFAQGKPRFARNDSERGTRRLSARVWRLLAEAAWQRGCDASFLLFRGPPLPVCHSEARSAGRGICSRGRGWQGARGRDCQPAKPYPLQACPKGLSEQIPFASLRASLASLGMTAKGCAARRRQALAADSSLHSRPAPLRRLLRPSCVPPTHPAYTEVAKSINHNKEGTCNV